MVAFLIAIAVSLGITWFGWRLDLRLGGGLTPLRMVLALALLFASTWVIALVHSATWLQIPGSYGPIQYWTDDPGGGRDFFAIRGLAMFALLCNAPLTIIVAIATVAGLSARRSVPACRLCVIPVVALATYAIALHQFFSHEFFPTV